MTTPDTPVPDSPVPTLRRVEATLLGTGTSTGVPVIGCRCRVCTSADARDRRLRTSAHVVAETDAGPVHLQIDAGPDFREQALRAGLHTIDAVLYTHAHFDHVVGTDDLRPFLFADRSPIPCYASPTTAAGLRRMLGYIFEDGSYPGVARLHLHEVDGEGGRPFTVVARPGAGSDAAVTVVPVPALHGRLPVLGFRIGPLAYLTDVSALPETSLALLEGVDTLVLDALRHEPHETHFTIAEATAVAQRVGARQTAFVHLTHSVLHAEEAARLPAGIALGHDGLVLTADA
ncbi:MAG: MBL fold metallo-hydrolase [Rubricoccaceae bacterium]